MKSPELEYQPESIVEKVDFSGGESYKRFVEIADGWPNYTESVKNLASNERAVSYVAEIDGQTAGIATLMLEGWENDQIILENFPNLPELSGLQVNEEYRGLGVGTKLVKTLENEAKKLGVELIGLGVEVENEDAINLYKKLDYKIEKVAGQDYFETHWTEKNENGEPYEYNAKCYLMLKNLGESI